ncbi:epoxide hydrolase 2-like [Nicotiana tabacum]|uniref:Epoxide hydrolase 2-like n=1 Tax=Nicotiana tabacum TaxID=4097 RepID=A0AC58S6J5_TOBAC
MMIRSSKTSSKEKVTSGKSVVQLKEVDDKPDVVAERGAPINDHTKFSMFHLVGDVIALIEAIAPNEDKVFVVGHDLGPLIAWHLSLFRPDKVKALIPGEIEAEFSPIGAKSVLKKFLRFCDSAPFYFPKGKGVEAIPDAPIELSSWLTEEDLNYYTNKFEQTGFTGGVNYYRAFPINWERTTPWTGAKVKVPAKFIVGELDLVYHIPGAKEYIHNGKLKKDVPLLEEVVVLKGAAHFVNQERPNEISKHIYDFIQKF